MPRGRPRYEGLLTPREQDVLKLLEEGLTNEQIAARLGISFSGARYHVAEIISKLGVSSRYEAVAWAQEQRATPGRLAGLALLLSRLRLGWQAGLAGAGLVAGVAVVVGLLLFGGGGAGTPEETYEPLAVYLDAGDAEAFLRSLQPQEQLEPGQVLYKRWEVYERHGPKAAQIYAANGIPVENYIREMWIEVGPNDTFVRGYGQVTDETGTPLLAYHTEGGVSRIIDVESGGLFRQDEVPLDLTVIGDPDAQIEEWLGWLEGGHLTVVRQTNESLVLEERRDMAYYEQFWRDRGFSEEQIREMRENSFFQRGAMEEESSYNVPFYGNLNAVELVVRMHVNSDGLNNKQETIIQTEAGEYIVVGSSEVEQAVVDAIPPEVIALTQID